MRGSWEFVQERTNRPLNRIAKIQPILRFAQWISRKQPVAIYGNSQQSCDFTYVNDIAGGTFTAMKPLGRGMFSLGSDRPVPLVPK